MDGQNAYDWVHFILRWFHVTGAITWVGPHSARDAFRPTRG